MAASGMGLPPARKKMTTYGKKKASIKNRLESIFDKISPAKPRKSTPGQDAEALAPSSSSLRAPPAGFDGPDERPLSMDAGNQKQPHSPKTTARLSVIISPKGSPAARDGRRDAVVLSPSVSLTSLSRLSLHSPGSSPTQADALQSSARLIVGVLESAAADDRPGDASTPSVAPQTPKPAKGKGKADAMDEEDGDPDVALSSHRRVRKVISVAASPRTPGQSLPASPTPVRSHRRSRHQSMTPEVQAFGRYRSLRPRLAVQLRPIADVTQPPTSGARRIKFLQPLLRHSNEPTHRDGPVGFDQWAERISARFLIQKIAEASYGEVYRLSYRDNPDSPVLLESILKVVALKPQKGTGPRKLKTGHMSAVQDVAMEVENLLRLNEIPGFTNFRDVFVLSGRMPQRFVEAWMTYVSNGAETLFPDPSDESSYAEDQLWAVIEMENAGTDMDRIRLRTDLQVWDVFWGVAIALAKAEETVDFEHRDLHLGNICVRPAYGDSLGLNMPDAVCEPVRRGQKFGLTMLRTTIIDYNLSRSLMDDGTETQLVHYDLEKDEELFQGRGEYQYDVYRYMRLAVAVPQPPIPLLASGEPASTPLARPDWSRSQLYTNVLWLHHLLVRLRELRTAEPPKMGGEPIEAAVIVAEQVAELLPVMEAILDPRGRTSVDIRSAKDLVLWAMGAGYLGLEDVISPENPHWRDTRPRPLHETLV
ncbi:MAG: hypothetical protein M1838_005527 [Thelocarpon superellum]|nr:MAG: hypothetical protein M1838_005527 [Thelocarpon superellum]